MVTEKEYIVTLKDPAEWDRFHEEMLEHCSHPHIPGRSVECANERPFSDTQTHYHLTDDEAEELSKDPRVLLIEPHIREIPNMKLRTFGSRTATYDNTNTVSASMKNWGLLRAISPSNPFAGVTSSNGPYTYNLTGAGVDIVVIDTGIAQNHPELAKNPDGTGGSRVVDYDWTQLGVPGITSLSGGGGVNGFLGDCDGHGTNCASIAAGNTCGWATDAAIYSMRAIPSYDGDDQDIVTGNVLGLMDITLVFDLVKAFHLAKPIGSNGYRRPTICTNSWGTIADYQSMIQTRWRGTTYPTSSPNTTYGQVDTYHDMRYNSLDVAAAEAMAAGVIIIGAAGNSAHKADVSGGLDYNNYWTDGTYAYYYHRGPSPGAAVATVSGTTYSAICVGALDRNSVERKAYFSNTGPRVDTYAPGYYISGAASTNYTSVADSRDGSGVYRISKLSGTSQATPQVAGILACLAQLRPGMDHNMARNWIVANSLTGILDENAAGGTGYTNQYYLQGGPNRIAQMPYNSPNSVSIQGAMSGPLPEVA